MRTRVFWNTDARNQKSHFDGCTQRTLGNGYAQGMGQIPDARNLHPAGNPSNHSLVALLEVLFQKDA